MRSNALAVHLTRVAVDDRRPSGNVVGESKGREQREDESEAFHAEIDAR